MTRALARVEARMTRARAIVTFVNAFAGFAAAALLAAGADAAFADSRDAVAVASAAALVEAMASARASEGFELRMTLTPVPAAPATPAAAPPETIKVAVIGRADAAGERVLVRGLAPERVRDAVVMAARVDARVTSRVTAGANAREGSTAVAPEARLFGTDLVTWDLLAPWWAWPDAQVTGTAEVGGHACTEVRSRAPAGPAAGADGAGTVAEVLSCVDARRGLAWRTRLYDRRHRLLRDIVVEREIRTQAGTSAAKVATITAADGRTTRVEVYAGDEHHRIEPGTFAALEGPAPDRAAR